MKLLETKNMRITDCIKWLWRTSYGLRLRILASGVVGLVHVGTSLLFVSVCKHLIDVATHTEEGSLTFYIGAMIGCMVVQVLASVCVSRLNAQTEINLRNKLCYQLFTHLMESRWFGREVLHTGDVINRLESDVYTVTDTLCRILPNVLVTLVQLVGAFVFLSLLDIRLAGALLFIMPIALLLSKSYMTKMRKLTREIRTTDSQVQTHLQEHLQHRTLVSTLEYTSQVTDTLSTLQSELRTLIMNRTDFSLFSRSMVQIGFSAGYLTAFLWGVFGLYGGTVTFGMMTAFLQLVGQVQRPLVDLSRQFPSFIHILTSIERLSELSALPLEEQGTPVRLEGSIGIRMENISFTYPSGTHPVLTGFSHNFAPGSLTAILGETGAGKSTLMRLMLALLMPDEGKVVFYNKEKEVTASPLTRCNLVYVPQGNTLMSGTIRENLLLGNPQATDEQLREVLHLAVADFVYTLPDGLETLCGELGSGLSEGQAQRIAIARGLLRPGGIMLLDEPSSSLDSETERTLLERLSHQMAHKTLILITHRETIAGLCTERVELTRHAEV